MSTCTKWVDHLEFEMTAWLEQARLDCIETLQQGACLEQADEGHYGEECIDWLAIKGDCKDWTAIKGDCASWDDCDFWHPLEMHWSCFLHRLELDSAWHL